MHGAGVAAATWFAGSYSIAAAIDRSIDRSVVEGAEILILSSTREGTVQQ